MPSHITWEPSGELPLPTSGSLFPWSRPVPIRNELKVWLEAAIRKGGLANRSSCGGSWRQPGTRLGFVPCVCDMAFRSPGCGLGLAAGAYSSIPALASRIDRFSIRSMPKRSLARFCGSIRWRLANEKIAYILVCVAVPAWRRCESSDLNEAICGRPNFRSRVFQKLVFRPPDFSFRASSVV
jgi:hypothetical protein